ncbi:MAG TPA: universal stress protein [Bacteroidales bacterium]|nr:universal stress protein [Bacteroidales bacterium]HPS74660.1 universal stress protein [Bacteroidales bacterium]
MEAASFQKILVLTDYSELSENAVTTAAAICQKHQATLILLYVLRDVEMEIPVDMHHLVMDYTKEMKLAAMTELKHLGDRISEEYKIEVSEIVAVGDVVRQIVKTVKEYNPDIVLIGSHGASGFRRFFIGSTAYSVLKHSTFPIMIIPGKGEWSHFRNILFPIRNIPNALEKYDPIRPILHKDQSTLHILGLSPESETSHEYELFGLEEKLEKRLQEDGVTYEVSYHRCANYADIILKKAEEKNIDLIVIIATLDMKLKEVFIGPFAQQIINHAKVPVLCIKAKEPVAPGSPAATP